MTDFNSLPQPDVIDYEWPTDPFTTELVPSFFGFRKLTPLNPEEVASQPTEGEI